MCFMLTTTLFGKYSEAWLKQTCFKADTWLRRTTTLGHGHFPNKLS